MEDSAKLQGSFITGFGPIVREFSKFPGRDQ